MNNSSQSLPQPFPQPFPWQLKFLPGDGVKRRMTFILLVLLFVAFLFNLIANGSQFICEFFWPCINNAMWFGKIQNLFFFYSWSFCFARTLHRNRIWRQPFNKYPLMPFLLVWYYPKVPQQSCTLLTLFGRSAFFRHLCHLKLHSPTCQSGWNFLFAERKHFGCHCIVSIK